MISAFTLMMLLKSAAAAEPKRITPEQLAQLGAPLAEDRVYYRWQSTASGENLHRVGVMDERTDQYFMNLKNGIAAGPGVYMADTPWSSASYLPASGGNLLEIRIAKGTRLIDLTDTATRAKLTNFGLDAEDIMNGRGLESGAVLKYENEWLVGKHLNGRARFALFPGPGTTPATAVDALERLSGRPLAQVANQLRERGHDLVSAIAEDPVHVVTALRLLDPAPARDLIRMRLESRTRPAARLNLWDHVARMPELVASIAEDPALRTLAARDMRAVMTDLIRNRQMDDHWDRLVEISLPEIALTEAERAQVTRTMINRRLNTHDLREDPRELVRRLRPLLAGVTYDAEERALFARRLGYVIGNLEHDVKAAPGFPELLRAAGVEDATLDRRLTRLAERRRLVNRAATLPTPENLLKALRSSRNLDELNRVSHAMKATLPEDVVREATVAFAHHHLDEFSRLITADADYRKATALAADLGDARVDDSIYRAAVRAEPGARSEYLAACLDQTRCRAVLNERLRADGGRIFAGIRDLTNPVILARAHSAADRARALEFYRLMIDAAAREPVQFAHLAPLLRYDLDERLRRHLATRALAIDPLHFGTRDYLKFARVVDDDLPGRRRLLAAAADAAINPHQLFEVADAASGARGFVVDHALARRFATLGPTTEDTERLAKLKLPAVTTRVKNASVPDACLAGLARLVDQ